MLGYPKHILLFSGLIIVMIVNGVLLRTVQGVPVTMFKIPSSVQSYVHCVQNSIQCTHPQCTKLHPQCTKLHPRCTKIHPVYKNTSSVQKFYDIIHVFVMITDGLMVFSACVAAVKSRPVLHHCVVIFFWSSGIMECTCMFCLDLKMEFCSCARGR